MSFITVKILLFALKANLSRMTLLNRICISDSSEAFKKPKNFERLKTGLTMPFSTCNTVEVSKGDLRITKILMKNFLKVT